MNKIISRKTQPTPMWEVLEQRFRRQQGWKVPKTVCVVRGHAGCGKTTYLLDYFKGKKIFYFSFAGLDEPLAERLFCEHIANETGIEVACWAECFQTIAANYKTIIFDDLSSISTYKRFMQAFYDNMITNINTRPFIVLVAQPTDNLDDMADHYEEVWLDYFSIPEVMNLYPDLSKYEALKLTTKTGGIPNLLTDETAFATLVPELLSKHFRRPENYHRIMHAIASGNHTISAIGKFTDFAYNKCDNYLIKLIDCGFITTNRNNLHKKQKTNYFLSNNYFKIWHKYIFLKQTAVALGEIIDIDFDSEAHRLHIEEAFDFVNREIDSFYSYTQIPRISYAPTTVNGYTFDAVKANNGKIVFVKVFESPDESCTKTEILKVQEAVMKEHIWYDCRIFVFCKKRFSDYAAAEAAKEGIFKLVGLERLR